MVGEGLLELGAVADLARDECENRWQSGDILLTEEEAQFGLANVKGESIDKSVRLAKLHARELAPSIEPTHVQRGFEVAFPEADAKLTGYMDIQEGAERFAIPRRRSVHPTATLRIRLCSWASTRSPPRCSMVQLPERCSSTTWSMAAGPRS